MDPDQAGCSLGPDLDPNCMQSLSADNKSRHLYGKNLGSNYLFHFPVLFMNYAVCYYYPHAF